MPWWLITLISVIGLMILLTGRVWCGYACPVGLLLDLLTALFKKLKVSQMKRSEKFNRLIRIFKYFFFVLSCGACSKLCPMQSKRISIQKTNGAVYSAECMEFY